jgi:hypothetical protein
MTRKYVSVIIIASLCSLWSACGAAAETPDTATPPYGPLRLVNQQPLQLLFLQPFPDMAEAVDAKRGLIHVNVALSNTLVEQNREVSADLDLEMVRAVLDLRYGLVSGLEVGFELPILFTYGGILDPFIQGVEDFFHATRDLRGDEDAGEFSYRVERGDRLLLQGDEDALGPGDVVLKVKVRVLRERPLVPAMSLRAAVKLPTGSTSRAFGSGEVDGGFGLLLQKTLARWTFYVNADVIFPGAAFEAADLSLQPFFSGVAAAEWHLSHRLSMVLQVRGDTRPFHDTIPILDKQLIESLLGFNWALSRSLQLQGGLAEDQFNSACCAADVSFFLNMTGRL